MNARTAQYPLREKRKKQNRTGLMVAAIDLFAEKGYAETTLEAIAAKAGLHVQTLYKHFPAKANLVEEIWHESLSRFEVFFASRECDALSAWRNWIEQNALELTREGDSEYRRRRNSFMEISFVSNATLQYWYRYQEVLAEGIALDMGIDVAHDPLPTLIACMLWGGNDNAARNWANSGTKDDLVKVLLKVVDTVIDEFQHRLSPQG